MSDQTTNLTLPFLMPAQAQKHVTVNESLTRLDALVQTAVESRGVSAEPGSPSDGQIWITPVGKTGTDWDAFGEHVLAYYRDGAWEQINPKEGWRAYIRDEARFAVFDGSVWNLDTEGLGPLLGVASLNGGALAGFRNRLMNGCGAIDQRGVASVADDAYCFDRWYALTQTDTVAPSQLTDPEDGSPTAMRLDQEQASAQRMGLAQIIEGANCRDLRAGQATFSGRVRLSASANVRYAILEWTGTADAVTSDVVNDWTSATYTGGNFFNSTTLNVLAVGSAACTADTWRDLDALTATIGAAAENLIVLVWTEGTAAQNVTLDLARLQLEPGATATPFERRPEGAELALCQRYFERLATGAAFGQLASGAVTAATQCRFTLIYAAKRTPPTVSYSGTLYAQTSTAATLSNMTAVQIGPNRAQARGDIASGPTVGFAALLTANNDAAAYIDLKAEL